MLKVILFVIGGRRDDKVDIIQEQHRMAFLRILNSNGVVQLKDAGCGFDAIKIEVNEALPAFFVFIETGSFYINNLPKGTCKRAHENEKNYEQFDERD